MIGEERASEAAGAANRSRPAPVVAVRALGVRFGGVVALDGVSLDLRAGEILGVIGPNGAGKTTLLNCLSRLYTPTTGDIMLEGRSILGCAPHAMAGLGVGRTFQNVALFASMTVRENVRVGAHARTASTFLTDAVRPPATRRADAQEAARADDILRALGLAAAADRVVADLPFGWRKRVELARALAGEPKVLLLDEPAGGLAHEEAEALAQTLRQIRDERGLSILLIDHHMGLMMATSDRLVALHFGRTIAEGAPDAVRRDPAVIHAYLGAARS